MVGAIELRGGAMAVAKVVELSASSTESFEDAIQSGIAKAGETLRGLSGAWVKEQKVEISGGTITEYRVNLQVTFVLD
jgi:flavin-binding protein dodecin